MLRQCSRYGMGLLAALMMTTPALAQDALEEIVVTAQKRSERVQEVPIQIDVFTAQGIADAGIRSTSDFIAYVPNMTFDRADTYRNSFVVIRGLAQVTNADPPIAVVVDGVPQVDQKQFNMRMFDLNQIEVLKGPQGTLYGRNALGGAVIVNTSPPADQLSGFASLSGGNGSAVTASAGVSGPLGSDRALFRLSADYTQQDGLIENAYLGEHADYIDYDWTTRARLRIEANDDWTVDVRGEYGRFSGSSNQYSWISSADPNEFLDPTYSFYPNSSGWSGSGLVKIDGDLGFATLTWINGYNRLTEVNRADLDFSNPVQDPGGFLGLGFQVGQGQDFDTRIYSEELRLTSSGAGPLRWVVGASYQYSDKSLHTRAFVDLDGSAGQIDNPALVILNLDVRNRYRSMGGFVQVDYDILPALTATAGVRFDRDTREQRDLVNGGSSDATFSAWQPKVTLTWKPADHRMFYGTLSSGYRPGGFNASPIVPTYRKEYVRNVEAGFKSTFLDERLTVDGALFYMRDSDYQYYYVDVRTASQINQNIERVDIKGGEVSVQWRPTDAWSLFADFGYSDATIEELTAYPEYEGNYTPNLTPWNASVGTEYRARLTDKLKWYGRIDAQLYGKKYWQLDNVDVQDRKEYLNLRLGVEAERWSVYLWGRNLTDTEAYSQYVSPALGVGVAGIGFRVPPATYGIELRTNF